MIRTIDAAKGLRLLAIALVILTFPLAAFGETSTEDEGEFPGPSHFLRGGYQYGSVLQTTDFLKGDNSTGEPIDQFQSVRIDFGWQTDGSKDWHHVYNMPTFGLGLFWANYPQTDELGDPSSLYGFFHWPFSRTERWTFNFELNFGFTNDWKPYDPVTNDQQTSMGLGRSVHIEVGASAEYRLARKWSLILAMSGTHFSNGGTQRPNNGLNQVGPGLYAKFDVDTPITPPVRRDIAFTDKGWDLMVTGSYGKRNLDLEIDDPENPEEWLNRSYTIANLTVGAGRKFSNMFRYYLGLDFCYDGSVGDIERVDGINNGYNVEPKSSDYLDLAAVAGIEANANRTDVIIHLGYKLITKDVPGRLPVFYQRLGVRQYVWQDWFVGMNVRFHELGSADNLECNAG
jgi:hypothetical protein